MRHAFLLHPLHRDDSDPSRRPLITTAAKDSDRQPTRADLAKAKARFEAERRLDDSDSCLKRFKQSLSVKGLEL